MSFIKQEEGQGIVEYTSILAFVALLIALCFSFSRGTLSAALSQSFSSATAQLSSLATQAQAGS